MGFFNLDKINNYLARCEERKNAFDLICKETTSNENKVYDTTFADLIILTLSGKILLLKRTAESKIGPSLWCIPGGHVDPGEEPDLTVYRETLEETSLDLLNINKLGAIPNPKDSLSHYYYTYVSDESDYNVIIDLNEHVEYSWFTWEEIKTKELLFDLKERLSLFLPSLFHHNFTEDSVDIRNKNFISYIKQNESWLTNSYFWNQDIYKLSKGVTDEFNESIDSLLDDNEISLDNYLKLKKSQDFDLLKALDPSHGGKLVKKEVTDNTGRKQIKWVSKEQADVKDESSPVDEKDNKENNNNNLTKKDLQDHAKSASEEALKEAIKSSRDPDVVEAAKHELVGRDPSQHDDKTVKEVSENHHDPNVRKEAKKELNSRDSAKKDKVLEKSFEKVAALDTYAKDFDQTDKYEIELNQFAGKFNQEAQQHFESLTGEPFSVGTVVKMCGGIPSTDVKIKRLSCSTDLNEDDQVEVTVVLKTDQYIMSRIFADNGTCYNEQIEVLKKSEDKNVGLGTRLFTNQVNELSKYPKIKNIKASCAKNTNSATTLMNGYYTWARLGYDIGDKKQFASWAKDNKSDAKTFGEQMSTPEGRKLWLDKGTTFKGVFSLKDKSYSKLVLQNYLKSKTSEKLETKETKNNKK